LIRHKTGGTIADRCCGRYCLRRGVQPRFQVVGFQDLD
jgi:hypothetical protein